jgi:hypothetical protein
VQKRYSFWFLVIFRLRWTFDSHACSMQYCNMDTVWKLSCLVDEW